MHIYTRIRKNVNFGCTEVVKPSQLKGFHKSQLFAIVVRPEQFYYCCCKENSAELTVLGRTKIRVRSGYINPTVVGTILYCTIALDYNPFQISWKYIGSNKIVFRQTASFMGKKFRVQNCIPISQEVRY